MAENHLDGRVIGIALDGTGYGTDGRIWGGEILVCDDAESVRVGHLDYIPLPGGAAAVREPWRMAVSYLFHHFGPDFWKLDIPFVRQLDRRRTENLLKVTANDRLSPLTSSAGRLFDTVAALAGIRGEVNYEAQAAIELEAAIKASQDATGYPFTVRNDGDAWIVDSAPMFHALIADLRAGVSTGAVSRKFHLGLVDALATVAGGVRETSGLDRVCLSGGTFMNRFLAEHLERRLERLSFKVFTHSEVPCGDGGLSLGQALVAARRTGMKR
jgi:hydrogenase maturation protein HypF